MNRPQLIIDGGGPQPVPESAFDVSPAIGPAPLTVVFTDRSANSPTAWSWSFGDPASGPNNISAAQHPSHTFASPGSYIVSLTAANQAGPGSPATRTITVTTSGAGDPVLVGAGDIADCGRTQDESTARLLDAIDGTVMTVGDNAYENGTAAEFANCYEPTWGRHKGRTKPAPGNHEYATPGATGYFGYFGAAAGDPAKGYYSFDVGTWHAVVLNSNCSLVGGCGKTSAQTTWLRSDLAAHPATCTVAIWHHPRFTSTRPAPYGTVAPLWQALYDNGADLVINGHQHHYERFAPQNPAGGADAAFGIRQFVVGTGGRSLNAFTTPMANSETRNSSTWGVLKLTLHPSSYDFEFVPIAGQTFSDGGSGSCHGSPSSATLAASQAATDAELSRLAIDATQRARRGLTAPAFGCDILYPAAVAPRQTASTSTQRSRRVH